MPWTVAEPVLAVKRGVRFGDLYAVTGALTPGAKVITTGAYELSDGESVVADRGASVSIGTSR